MLFAVLLSLSGCQNKTANQVEECAPPSPEVIWSLTPQNASELLAQNGCRFLPGGGPDGSDAWRVTGSPHLVLDSARMRGKLVVIEAWVKGENLGKNESDTLRLSANYKVRHHELYPPAPARKGTYGWTRFIASLRVTEFARNLRLTFGHAGASGVAEYAKVRILAVPPMPEHVGKDDPASARTRYRGAMAGDLRKEEDFREFAENWNGYLLRWQFQGTERKFSDPESYQAWGREEIAKLDRIMPWLAKYKIKIVLDLHRSPGIHDRALRNYGMWDKPLQDQIIALWENIARHYKNNPQIYGYDLMNEPVERTYDPFNGALDWNRLAERIGRSIRAIDPDVRLLVTAANGGGPTAISAMRPIGLDNVVYTAHFYEPGNFTHNGVIGNPMNPIWRIRRIAGTRRICADAFHRFGNFSSVTMFRFSSGSSGWHAGRAAAKIGSMTVSASLKNMAGTGRIMPIGNGMGGASNTSERAET